MASAHSALTPATSRAVAALQAGDTYEAQQLFKSTYHRQRKKGGPTEGAYDVLKVWPQCYMARGRSQGLSSRIEIATERVEIALLGCRTCKIALSKSSLAILNSGPYTLSVVPVAFFCAGGGSATALGWTDHMRG